MNKIFAFQGGDIRYSDCGSGNCIVLLHGFTESLDIWENLTAILCKDFRVIAIDLPGHGESSVYGDIHTMSFMAQTVKTLVDFLNISDLLLIGHSMGGYVCLEFAKQYPAMLSGLGLFHSHAMPDSDTEKKNRDRVIELVKSHKFEFLNQFIPSLFAPENQIGLQKEIEKLKTDAEVNMSEIAILAALEGMKSRNGHISTLAEMEVPVFYIIGKKDSRINVSSVIAQTLLPPDCWVQVLDCGHMGYLEAPQQTVSFVRSFAKYIFEVK